MGKKKNHGKKKNDPAAQGEGSDKPSDSQKEEKPVAATQPKSQTQPPKPPDHAASDAPKVVSQPSTSSMSGSRSQGQPPISHSDPPCKPGASGDNRETVQGGSGRPRPSGASELSGQVARIRISGSTKGSYANPFTSLEERKHHSGKAGKPIKLLANHFPINLQRKTVVHYDVDLKIVQFKRPPRKSDIDITMRAFVKMVKDNPRVFTKPNGVVFDGIKNAFSTEKLKFANNAPSFDTNVNVRELSDLDREVEVAITITMVGNVNIGDAMNEFIRQQRTGVQERRDESYHVGAIQALNIILGMAPRLSFTTINRSHFPPKAQVLDLGQGKSLWVGTFKSVRVGWKLVLNVDMANKPGYEKKYVMQFIQEFLSRPGFGRSPPQIPNENQLVGLLQDKRNFENVSKELKGLKVRFYRPGGPRQYRVNCLTTQNSKNLTLDIEGVKMSVHDYFVKEFKVKLKFPDLPCLHVGNPNRTIYWPIEMCEIQKQEAPKSKKLTEDQAAAMVRQTAMPPSQRKDLVSKGLKDLMNSYRDDPYAREFGISVNDRMMDITGRVLEAPTLNYLDEKDVKKRVDIQVGGGKWMMRRSKFIEGKSLDCWGVLNLSRLPQNQVERFVDGLYNEGRNCGLSIDCPLHLSGREDERQVEGHFEGLFQRVKEEVKQEPQLIMVIGSRKGSIRDLVKHMSDVKHGIPSQYILEKTVKNANQQIYHNVCLKLNSKLGGTNQILAPASKPDVLKRPVMLMGADVTHPAPGERKPSIAAVVGSCDPSASLYNTEVSFQFGDQAIEEITKLEEMTCRLLIKFYEKTGKRKPERIIFYRDGVSEGQFEIVLAKELTAIQRACTRMEKDYKPGITFVIAQKRHNTRFFPQNPHEGIGRGKNIPPGTTVDIDVTHPTETSFYLASHEGIQGTTKPTHYHLLSDDNGFNADELQRLTYYLCHLYSRCERSVSYPSPTYYAHLAAFRARGHHNALLGRNQGNDTTELERIERMTVVNHFI